MCFTYNRGPTGAGISEWDDNFSEKSENGVSYRVMLIVFLKQIVGQFEFEVVPLTENYRKDSGEVLWKISSKKWKS